jgi:hypothetical protein
MPLYQRNIFGGIDVMPDKGEKVSTGRKGRVLRSLKELFGDTSKPVAATLSELEEIRDEVDTYIDALRYIQEK